MISPQPSKLEAANVYLSDWLCFHGGGGSGCPAMTNVFCRFQLQSPQFPEQTGVRTGACLSTFARLLFTVNLSPKVTLTTRSSSSNILRRLRKIFSTNDLNCDACHPVPAQSALRTRTFFWLCWHNLGSPTSLLAKYVFLPNPQIPQSWKVTVLKSWRRCTMYLRGSAGRQNRSSAERPKSSIRLEAVRVWSLEMAISQI